jgi:hypothetical protein
MHRSRPLDQLRPRGITVTLEQGAQLGPCMNHVGCIDEQVFFKRHGLDAARPRSVINAGVADNFPAFSKPPCKKARQTAVRRRIFPSASAGEVAEWSIATVLKTVGPKGPGGSNPSLSAIC